MVESRQQDRAPTEGVTERIESLSCMDWGISHDFNNMLAAILANTEAVLGQGPLDAKIRPYIDRIASNTRSAIALTRRIQMFTEDGGAICETVNLAELVAHVVDALEDTLPTGCTIDTDELDATCAVTIIPRLLQEAVSALIENAIESLLGNRGEVHIRVRRAVPPAPPENGIVLGLVKAGVCTLLEVEDSGEGMTPKVLNRIFDPFFTTRLRARGLGLTPVVGLIHSCPVALQVQSQKGRGTTMRLIFG